MIAFRDTALSEHGPPARSSALAAQRCLTCAGVRLCGRHAMSERQREAARLTGQRNRTHGMTDSPTWKSWKSMLDRCYGSSRSDNHIYQGRGITVCDRWKASFEAFLSDMGERPEGKTLDRYPDNDGNYEPGNVRWATNEEQGRNRRTNRILTHEGRSMCMKDWAIETGIPVTTLCERLRTGWPIELALTRPVRQKRIQETKEPGGVSSDVPFE
jgi:hypothetical protein